MMTVQQMEREKAYLEQQLAQARHQQQVAAINIQRLEGAVLAYQMILETAPAMDWFQSLDLSKLKDYLVPIGPVIKDEPEKKAEEPVEDVKAA